MRTRLGLGAALMLAATLTVPAVATAAPADCGTTPAQWVGTYTGQIEDEHNGEVYYTPLRVVVADDGGELTVDSYVRDTHEPQDGETILEAGNISWATERWFDTTLIADFFDSTSSTCGVDGRVTAFAGPHEVFAGPPWGRYPAGTFEVARTS